MPTLLIDGKWVAASGGQTIDVINPCDAKAYSTLDRGTAADIDLAVKAAQRAMDGAWGNLTATERGPSTRRPACPAEPYHCSHWLRVGSSRCVSSQRRTDAMPSVIGCRRTEATALQSTDSPKALPIMSGLDRLSL